MSDAAVFTRGDESLKVSLSVPVHDWKAMLAIAGFRGFDGLGSSVAVDAGPLYVEDDVAEELAGSLREWRLGLPPIDPEYGTEDEVSPEFGDWATLVIAWCEAGGFRLAITPTFGAIP
jgi:hypothetical protein